MCSGASALAPRWPTTSTGDGGSPGDGVVPVVPAVAIPAVTVTDTNVAAISVPAPIAPSELPIGVQLVARRGEDSALLKTAAMLAQAPAKIGGNKADA